MVPCYLHTVTTDRLRWLLLGLAAIVLVVHSLAYNFVTDDAYISFVYSRNFAEHGQLAFNLGSPVEGYTNFLWTFLIGVLMIPGIPPEISSRVLGTACGLATLYFVFRAMERALGKKTPWAAVPSLVLACSSGFACWTSGGLETQLFTLLCAVAIDAVVAAERDARALRRAGIALALAAMTRPEGLLVAAVIAVTRFVSNVMARRDTDRVTIELRIRRLRIPLHVGRSELVAAAWFLAVWAPWFAWRWWYYGWPFPNTYYVKATGTWLGPDLAKQMRDAGFYYIWVWLKQTGLLYALPVAVLGLVAKPRTPRFALALACGLLAIVYVPYAISVGGDFMGLHRFIMPLFVVAAVAVALGLEQIVARIPHRAGLALPAIVVAGFALAQLGLTRESLRWGNFANDRGIDTPAFLIVYTDDRAEIGRAMAGCFRDDDFSIVGGAGAQPYYARMRGVDVFGLVSDRIAHEEPRIRARPGHTKFGSDTLLAQYDPTFVFSCYEIHAKPEQPRLPCAPFWLGRGYEEVTIHVPGMRQLGEYYTFLAKKTRAFQCPGRVQ